jgi:cell division protein FtsI (penicillin-binding protein 3)
VGVSTVVNQFYGATPERFIQHLKDFGFDQQVNNQLVGEPAPKLIEPGSEEWTMATLPSMSFGYSIGVTPLQMATFYNGLANEGRLVRPWIVKEIRNNSQVIRSFGPEVLNPQMVSKQTAIQIREVMKGVIEYGTAAGQFRGMPFEVAGKTGTVRKIQNGRYVKRYRASFGGYFPANNPRYSLYIMIDEPDAGSSSGGRVAGPIFRRIAEQVYTMDMEMSKPPLKVDEAPVRKPASGVIFAESARQVYGTMGIKTSGLPESDWVAAKSNGHQVNFTAVDLSENKIPNLRGMTSRDAINLLEKMGVSVTLKGIGRVRRQSLLPGYRVGNDASITLFLG